MDCRQSLIGDPGGAELTALGHPGRHPERDRHPGRLRRQHRDLIGQQVAELLQPQPGGQRKLTDRGVAGQLPPAVAVIGPQAAQSVQEQPGEVGLQVLDRHVRLGRPAYCQVHPHLPARAVEQRPGGPVGERLRLGMTLADRPPVEQRQDAHVLGPGRRREPLRHRARRPVLGVLAEGLLQPGTRVEQGDAMHGQELHPLLDRPRVVLPRLRRRRPAGRQLPQPPVHRHRRPRSAGPALEPEVVIDQHRHALGYQRPVTDIPGLPALAGKEAQDHEG